MKRLKDTETSPVAFNLISKHYNDPDDRERSRTRWYTVIYGFASSVLNGFFIFQTKLKTKSIYSRRHSSTEWPAGSWEPRPPPGKTWNGAREARPAVFPEKLETPSSWTFQPRGYSKYSGEMGGGDWQTHTRTDGHQQVHLPSPSCCRSSSGPKAQWLTPRSNAAQNQMVKDGGDESRSLSHCPTGNAHTHTRRQEPTHVHMTRHMLNLVRTHLA